MHTWKKFLISGAVIASSLAMTAPLTFAATGKMSEKMVASGLTLAKGQTSITLTVPNLDNTLQPANTLQFVFSEVNSSSVTMTTTGTLISGTTDEYNVPVPNFEQPEEVNISVTYAYNGVNYTATAGPLLDTLPEVPLAAALPLGMLGVWYVMRKRRMSAGQM